MGGRAVKGPTESFCAQAGIEQSAAGIVAAYDGVLDGDRGRRGRERPALAHDRHADGHPGGPPPGGGAAAIELGSAPLPMRTLAILPVKAFGAAKQRLVAGAPGARPAPRSPRRWSRTCWPRSGRSRELGARGGGHGRAARTRGSASRRGPRCSRTLREAGQSAGRADRGRATPWRPATSGRCSCPATRRCSTRARSSALLARRRRAGHDRARPPRHRHERAPARAAGRDRAELRPGQLRAPPAGGRAAGAAGRGAPADAHCSTWTPATTSAELAAGPGTPGRARRPPRAPRSPRTRVTA